jgi:signal peptidase I
MTTSRGRTLLVTLCTVVVAGCALLLVGPAALGGPTSILAVSGNSMEPRIDAGDLILVRAGGPYHVGQIVAYHNIPAKATFLHRIVAVRGTGFAMKGDHNGWVDPGTAQPGQVVGRLWIRIPGAGSAFRWVAYPLHGALLAGAAALLIGWRDTRRRRRRRRARAEGLPDGTAPPIIAPAAADLPKNVAAGPWSWRPPPVGRVPVDAILKTALAAALVGAAACAFLGVVSFTRSTATAGRPAPLFRQSGTLSYLATAAPSAVYPTGRVTSPTPIYVHLVKSATFSFRYHVAASGTTAVSGTAAIRVVLEGNTGWRRVVAQTPPRAFHGATVTLQQRVSVRSLRSLLANVQALTASPDSYMLEVAPVVVTHGTAESGPFVRRFSPQFSFQFTDAEMTMTGGGPGGASAFSSRALETAKPSGTQANQLSVGPIRMAVTWWRMLALVLGAAMLALAAGAALAAHRRLARRGEPALISAKHRDLLVPLALAPAEGERHVTVQSFEDLIRVARRHETTVMHHGAADGSEHYLVLADGVTFRYRSQPVVAAPARDKPASETDAA